MKPGSVFVMPKADRRYKPGVIKKDPKGKWRGHPDTVTLQHGNGLNPPLMVTEPLMQWMKKQGII